MEDLALSLSHIGTRPSIRWFPQYLAVGIGANGPQVFQPDGGGVNMGMQTEDAVGPAHAHQAQRLLDLLHDAAASAPAEQADRLQEAFCLYAGMRPAPAGVSVPEPSVFGHFLASGAHESAALSLIGQQSGWLLSRSAAGTSMATVKLQGYGEESTVEAATPALALLCAQLACLVQMTQRSSVAPDAPALVRAPVASRLH